VNGCAGHYRGFVLLVVTSVAIIAYFTLFPFDFHRSGVSLADAVSDFDSQVTEGYVWLDVTSNLVLFVPFGFGVAGLLRARAVARGPARLATVAAGLALAFCIELLQALYLTRFASTTDVVVNAIGAAVGAEVALRWAGPAVGAWTAAVRWAARWLSAGRFIALASIWLLLWTAIAAFTVDLMELQDWDPSYPLIVGNEVGGDRPWDGTVTSLLVVDTVLDDDELDAVVAADSTGSPTEDRPDENPQVVASHDFTAGMKGFPEVEWVGSGTPDRTAAGVRMSDDSWLRSTRPATEISRALERTSQFTLVLEAATGSREQYGPARLMSISGGTLERNITLGQEGSDLALRFRTTVFGPDGTSPELLVPGVFADDSAQRIVVRYDGSTVSVDVGSDGGVRIERNTEFAPEIAAQIRGFPNAIEALQLDSTGTPILLAVYRSIVLLPFSFILGRWFRRDGRRTVVSAAGIAVVVVFELLLIAGVPRYDWRVARLTMTAAVLAGSVLVLLYAARWLEAAHRRPPAPTAGRPAP
jgi:glycopeptide antibiotics resistance protein